MFDEFDKYISMFAEEDFAVDYWYDEGAEIAENMLCEFKEEDWKILLKIVPERKIQWQKRVAYCMHDKSDQNQLKVLLNLVETDDDELLEIVVDSLRGFTSEESLKLIYADSRMVSKIKKLMPKVGDATKRVFEEFLKVNRILAILSVFFLLCGCSKEQINQEANQEAPSDEQIGYFFPQEVDSQEYTAVFSGFSGQPEQMKVTVSVTEVQRLEDGVLYELEVDSDEEGFDRYEEYRGKWWYIGLFFVQGEDIYFIRGEDVQNEFRSAEEIQEAGTLVCNEAGKEDSLGEDIKGWHEYIAADGDRREYHAYSDLVETGYYECFIWEAGSGLIEYRSGYGAQSNHIELHLSGGDSYEVYR
ncbi:MAG: hypothetical protein NC517_05920 [Firmicutes bacterium]|nr:hypothetical protein [Bacillota bacterium]